MLFPHESFREFFGAKFVMESGPLQEPLLLYLIPKRGLNHVVQLVISPDIECGIESIVLSTIALQLASTLVKNRCQKLFRCKTKKHAALVEKLDSVQPSEVTQGSVPKFMRKTSLRDIRPCWSCIKNVNKGSSIDVVNTYQNCLHILNAETNAERRAQIFSSTLQRILLPDK